MIKALLKFKKIIAFIIILLYNAYNSIGKRRAEGILPFLKVSFNQIHPLSRYINIIWGFFFIETSKIFYGFFQAEYAKTKNMQPAKNN